MHVVTGQLKDAKGRVYLNRHFKNAIKDIRWLAANVCARPTQIAELIPKPLLHVGFSDAVESDMGSV